MIEYEVCWSGRGSLPGAKDWPHQRRPTIEPEPMYTDDWLTTEECQRIAKHAPKGDTGWYPVAEGKRPRGRPRGYPASGAAVSGSRRRLERVTVCVEDGTVLTPTEIRLGCIRCRECRRARRKSDSR